MDNPSIVVIFPIKYYWIIHIIINIIINITIPFNNNIINITIPFMVILVL